MKKSLLRAVARANHLQCSYRNVNGEIVWSPETTLIKLLEDLNKTKINSNLDLETLWDKKLAERYLKILPKSLVCWNGECRAFNLYLKEAPQSSYQIQIKNDETDEVLNVTAKTLSSQLTRFGHKVKVIFEEKLKVGYYTIEANIAGTLTKSFIISAPEKIMKDNQKSWGPFVPLYALRTNDDWGIGSFKELKKLAQLIKKNGASWIGLLPMLASNFDYEDCDPSPYSSLTRLFWNEIYLDVEGIIKKYHAKDLENKVATKDFQQKLEELRKLEFVDYYRVYQIKKEILLPLSRAFFANGLDQKKDYLEFTKENSEIEAYAKFRSDILEEQNFHKFVQFEMNLALKEFNNETGVGLYMDYPVGVNDAGFDFKAMREVFFGEVSVGAPPEPVFALGQDWGFPAFHPEAMITDCYRYFRQSLKHHLKFSKILRLDHIMGLFRIYSVPKKFKGDQGVYLRFPPEDLFAVVITEAYRHGVDLIGENLGTVPAAVDRIIKERNLNGMWVLQCETWRSPEKAMAAIHENALLCVNTHDMPMLKSFRDASDLTLVESLNILSKKYKEQFELKRHEQMKVWEGEFSKEKFVVNVINKISESKGKYFVLNLEDPMGESRPQNIPGTWKEYPNWRKKFLLSLEQFEDHKGMKETLDILRRTRS